MLGTRYPRATYPASRKPPRGVKTAPARKVKLEASSESSGQRGWPLTSGESDALASYHDAPQRRAPDKRRRPGTASKESVAKTPALLKVAPSGTRPRRTVTTSVTGFTPNEGASIFSKKRSPPAVRLWPPHVLARRSWPPFAAGRSYSWLIAAG